MNMKLIGAAMVASLAMAGCGTLSDVDSQGRTSEPVFPDVEKASFEKGAYPNIENLRKVRDGLTRDQLYELLGRPHFAEGFRVREWDYLFHFDTPQGVKTCQFKVLFDTDRIARSFHWAPAECADLLDPKPVEPIEPFSLSGDVSFPFGSATLTAAGQQAVRNVVAELRKLSRIERLTVSGHTDHIGNADANQRLSEARAEAVRRALIAEGVPASVIVAQGFGATRPLVQCNQSDRSERIACLAPNRRVDIDVQGQR